MINNNYTKKILRLFSPSSGGSLKKKSKPIGLFGFVATLLLTVAAQAQTDRIPVADGSFSNPGSFAGNGWQVANEGVNPSKWVVGTAVSATNGGTTQATTATGMGALTYSVTLAAANNNIAIGQ